MQYPNSVPAVGLSGGKFTNGNPLGGIPASLDRAEDMNLIYDELIAVVVAGGLTPTEGVATQVRDAILALINGGDYKQSVRVASTAAINLASPGANIDGVAMVAGDRFLEKDNATAANRGIYIWNGAAVPATRAPDADTGAEINSGAIIPVEQGTVNADTNWQLTTDGTVTMGTTALTFQQIAPPSSSVQGSFKNLQASCTGLSALITVTADELVVENLSNQYQVLRNVSLNTISTITAGANGIDTGTTGASTWYSLWVIWNGTTTAGLLSLSATAPTMPGGYTHKARVGWVRTDATGNKYPLSFIQNGRDVQYKTVVASNLLGYPKLAVGVQGTINGSTFTPVTVSLANFTPPTAAKVRVGIYQSSVAGTVALAPNSVFAGFSTANPPPMMLDNVASAPLLTASEFVLETTNLYFASTDANNFAHLMGWTDNI